MAREFQVVCLDDSESDGNRTKGTLAYGWKKYCATAGTLEIRYYPFSKGEELFARDDFQPDLLMIDLMEQSEGVRGESSFPTGLRLIQAARERLPGVPIIAVSNWSELKDRAIEDGAVHFFEKPYLWDASAKAMAKVREFLERSPAAEMYAQDRLSSPDADNLPLIAVIERIGKSHILALAASLLGIDIEGAKPSYVAPGGSGALVLRLECRPVVEPGRPGAVSRQLLLKASRDPELLMRELRSVEKVAHFPPDLFVRYPFLKEQAPARCGDWFAIGSDFTDSAQLAREWLSSPANADDVLTVMQRLWSERHGLGGVTVEAAPRPLRGDRAILDVALREARGARVQLAWRELVPLVEKHGHGVAMDASHLSTVLTKRCLGELDDHGRTDTSPSTHYCWSHGDLHVGNVLIETDLKRARLIDPVTIEQLPWPMDLARFVVSIVMECWDTGWGSHEWDRMPYWITTARAIVENQPIPDEGDNVTATTALTWLRVNLRNIHPVIPGTDLEWQFRLALAAEFLRSSYRTGLAAPKRVLGLLAGGEALRGAVAAYRL